VAPRVTPRQYHLLLTRSQKFAVVAPLVMFTVMPVVFILVFSSAEFATAANPSDVPPPLFPLFPFIFFLAFAAFYAWSVASLPYRITTTSDQELQFKSLINVRSARVSDLLLIEPRGLYVQAGVSGYVLQHRAGKIRFPGQFSDLYVLLGELKKANPELEIRGC